MRENAYQFSKKYCNILIFLFPLHCRASGKIITIIFLFATLIRTCQQPADGVVEMYKIYNCQASRRRAPQHYNLSD